VILALVQLAAATMMTPEGKDMLADLGMVRVQYVRGDHWAITSRAEIAKALRTADGQKWVLVNLDADQSDLDQWILHEMAHHVAWASHGEDIKTHGPEFRAACRALVMRRPDRFCNGD